MPELDPEPIPRRSIFDLAGHATARLGWRLNLLLVALTILTTAVWGLIFQGLDPLAVILAGSEGSHALGTALAGYTLPLLLILGSHEMGHYVACRIYGVDATLPYFIPSPLTFGTMGAVIRMRPPIPNRRALFDIGVAGPIAGFLVAVPVLVYGTATATVIPAAQAPAGGLDLGGSLLINFVERWSGPHVADGSLLMMSPAMVAGWFGCLVTAMNLFPVGQLDGGHVAFAIAPRWHRQIARSAACGMVALVAGSLAFEWAQRFSASHDRATLATAIAAGAGVAGYLLWSRMGRWGRIVGTSLIASVVIVGIAFSVLSAWLIWTLVLVLLARRPHPIVESATVPPGAARVLVALASLAIFVLTFPPMPIRILE